MMVKICGITRPQDAAAATRYGASAIGFIFWPNSPRFVDPYRARKIARLLPPFVSTVGVFVNQTAEYINGVASLVGLGAVQLHGEETPPDADRIHRPVVKAMALPAASASVGSFALSGLDAWPNAVTLLVDAYDSEKRGGTGQTVDWAMAARIASGRRTILAGGLTPDNVSEAIARVRPFGVDVSSGVESAPGIKDRAKIRALLERVHAVRT
jgi:phosphoribosylanthranilate isomerase